MGREDGGAQSTCAENTTKMTCDHYTHRVHTHKKKTQHICINFVHMSMICTPPTSLTTLRKMHSSLWPGHSGASLPPHPPSPAPAPAEPPPPPPAPNSPPPPGSLAPVPCPSRPLPLVLARLFRLLPLPARPRFGAMPCMAASYGLSASSSS